MKTILAYGDSLTYGANPRPDGLRHAYENRWPSVLEQGLGDNVRVIAEGLGGRTTAFDDGSASSDRNGARILPVLLDSHKPLDLVIVMLGSNDLKPAIHGRAITASYGIRKLIQVVRGHFVNPGEVTPKLLIVSPPHLVPTRHAEMGLHFGGDAAIAESKLMAGYYRTRAQEYGAEFYDAADVAHADPLDGVHLDPANTRAIGTGLVPVVKSLLGL
ncbi:Lysophospholipase L1 [Devosia sp. YR412]|uniref:SGNH/GDSL hydrolase family protein n=1 Tax=Devosia sp. YR412 TaxID=1881030 RepID=UPI0008C93211|nr:SGNH/GDSL hydrolase family protein [Devosia sp. YR412]SEQ47927.1 Lysophospholipase L1 [Devosia sp. YR412]